MKGKRPNIVVFMPETIRADVVFGGRAGAETPNMDRLSEEGVSFTNFFSHSPFCTPSRCSMFTGLYPHVNGHRSLQFLLQRHERNIFRDLKENGYITAAFGRNDLLAQDAVGLSFDFAGIVEHAKNSELLLPAAASAKQRKTRRELAEHKFAFYKGKLEEPWDKDWSCIQSALRFIQGEHEKPFCLFIPLFFAHPDYRVEEPYFSMYDRRQSKPPVPRKYNSKTKALSHVYGIRELSRLEDEDLSEIRAVYLGMVSRLDYQLGLVIRELVKRDLYDNTAVFVCSDHGDYAGDYGHVEKINYSFEDCLLNIPLIARIPGGSGNISRKCLAEAVDVYPTILELAGVQPQHYHFGRSLLPFFDEGVEDRHREKVFAEAGFMQYEKHCSTPLEPYLGTIYEKQIRFRHENPEKVQAIAHRRAMVRTEDYKYVFSPRDFEELYDLAKDPLETDNLAGRESYAPVKTAMKEELLEWFVETSDTAAMKHDKRGFGIKGVSEADNMQKRDGTVLS